MINSVLLNTTKARIVLDYVFFPYRLQYTCNYILYVCYSFGKFGKL